MTHGNSSLPGRRALRRPLLATLAVLLLLAAVWGGTGSLTGGGRLAAQVEPTSTPIRLQRITPAAAEPTAPPAAEGALPTVRPIVVIPIEATETAAAGTGDGEFTFAADDWEGGYYQGNGLWYGRAWTAVYGAASAYPAATLRFSLPEAPTEPLIFTVEGLDDELAGSNPIAIEINGRRVYEGDSPFASWDGTNQGRDAPWTRVEATLPASLFTAGENQITIRNLSPSGNFGLPPYILLSTATLE